MSAAILIALVPLVAGVIAFAVRQKPAWSGAVGLAATGTIAILLGVALQQGGVFGTLLNAGAGVFGRPLEVRPAIHAGLIVLFLAEFLLLLLALRGDAGWTFVPLGLGALAMFSASLMIRPFVLSAPLISAGGALISIMVQAEHVGERSTLGASRFLTLNILALPFMLAAGYFLQIAAGALDQAAIDAARENAGYSFHIGLLLLLGALPLFTWTHTVARDAPTLVTSFIASIFTGTLLLHAMSIRADNAWLALTTGAGLLRTLGTVALLAGALLGWAQRSFGRVVACALLVDAGASALLLHANTTGANGALALTALTRAASLGVLGLGLGVLRASREQDDFARLRGLFHAGPAAQVAVGAISIGGLSLAGLPGTLGFLQTWLRMRSMAPVDVEVAALFVLACLSIATGFLRGIAGTFAPASGEVTHQIARLKRRDTAGIMVACGAVIVLGVWPDPFTSLVAAAMAGLSGP